MANDTGETGLRLLVTAEGLFAYHPLPRQGEVQIGRSKDVEVPIDHESVSRRHAVLRLGSEPTLEDLGSANGTTVDDRRLEPGQRAAVKPGDMIRVGQVVLMLQRGVLEVSGDLGRGPTHNVFEPAPAQGSVVAASLAMRRVVEIVDSVAPTPLNVLVLGETGVGKEVVAQAIHARSPRARKMFLGLNCAALSEGLLESELFGHEPGAFTGADRRKAGLLECGDGGTIFLDEVGEMPLGCQAKLLRVIEERQVLRLGALKPRSIDVRFVAATNRDLVLAAREGRFRSDLYFRLNGMQLEVPPLRERLDDIEPLARRFLETFSAEIGRKPPVLSAGALEALKKHDWPGNVRELRNVVQRASIVCGPGPIEETHLVLVKQPAPQPTAPPTVAPPATPMAPPATPPPAEGGLKDEVHSLERARIKDALERCGGNQTHAAKLLGISRRSLIVKMDLYQLPRPRRREDRP
jgi:transcriptional regulator with GAF, ATPase, and Fis domain